MGAFVIEESQQVKGKPLKGPATPSPHSTHLLSRHTKGCEHTEASLIQSF